MIEVPYHLVARPGVDGPLPWPIERFWAWLSLPTETSADARRHDCEAVAADRTDGSRLMQ